MGQPRPLFVYFLSFQTNNRIFTTNICEKCLSSIQCRDSNPRPSQRQSLLITIRPGLTPSKILLENNLWRFNLRSIQWVSPIKFAPENKDIIRHFSFRKSVFKIYCNFNIDIQINRQLVDPTCPSTLVIQFTECPPQKMAPLTLP